MKKLLLILVLTFSLLTLPSCSQSTSEIICDYGGVLCDVSTTMCTQIPGIPVPVCNYLDLACYNLNQLCLYRDSIDTPAYQMALLNLQDVTEKLREWNTKQAQK